MSITLIIRLKVDGGQLSHIKALEVLITLIIRFKADGGRISRIKASPIFAVFQQSLKAAS